MQTKGFIPPVEAPAEAHLRATTKALREVLQGISTYNRQLEQGATPQSMMGGVISLAKGTLANAEIYLGAQAAKGTATPLKEPTKPVVKAGGQRPWPVALGLVKATGEHWRWHRWLVYVSTWVLLLVHIVRGVAILLGHPMQWVTVESVLFSVLFASAVTDELWAADVRLNPSGTAPH